MQHTATALCPAARGWRKSAPLPGTAVTATGHRAAESSIQALCRRGLTTRFLETQAFRVTEVVGGRSWFPLTPLQAFPSALCSPVDVQCVELTPQTAFFSGCVSVPPPSNLGTRLRHRQSTQQEPPRSNCSINPRSFQTKAFSYQPPLVTCTPNTDLLSAPRLVPHPLPPTDAEYFMHIKLFLIRHFLCPPVTELFWRVSKPRARCFFPPLSRQQPSPEQSFPSKQLYPVAPSSSELWDSFLVGTSDPAACFLAHCSEPNPLAFMQFAPHHSH